MRMICAVSGLLLLLATAQPVLHAAESPTPIPVEDYPLYDQIVMSKFLTSDTRLVVLERMTVARLIPNDEGPMTEKLFREQGYFDSELPSDLLRDFVAANQKPTRLEGRFQFGIRYRFVSGDTLEEPEVRFAVPVASDDGMSKPGVPVLDRLAFSKIGRTLRNDQALAYVENTRSDGTGAGFLIWFRRQGREWTLFDTDVIWTARPQATENPLLAP